MERFKRWFPDAEDVPFVKMFASCRQPADWTATLLTVLGMLMVAILLAQVFTLEQARIIGTAALIGAFSMRRS